MKFVYLGYDFMLDSVRTLLAAGHELAGIFTFPCDNLFNFSVQTYDLAKELGVPCVEPPITKADIAQYIGAGVTVFLAAGYPYKIPEIDEKSAYGVNVHPSYLPKGRGIMPTPSIIMGRDDAAGISIHKIVPDFDAGDILYQKQLPLSAQETVETYSARCAMESARVLPVLFKDLDSYWNAATPQIKVDAETFMMPDDAMRMLDWNEHVLKLDAKARAFGRFGCLGSIGDETWVIYGHSFWEEDHNYPLGTIALNQPGQIVVATQGGFFVIVQGQKLEG